MAFEERITGRLAHRQGDTILNMVTLSHSLDIPKAERSPKLLVNWHHFSRVQLLCRTCLYRIFKLKEGCTPTEWREKMAENVAVEDKKQD